ncbi:hypothetical protein N7236_04775, partial [Escherichia coli]|nr:hypothetical protein [Escherichia coli]
MSHRRSTVKGSLSFANPTVRAWLFQILAVVAVVGIVGWLFGTVAKLAMRQPFVLFKGLTFQKLCLPGAFRPGDHHNK